MIRWTAFALSVALAVSVIVAAETPKPEDAEKLINSGLKAYKEGKLNEAVSQLQAAISAIQATLQKSMSAIFPKAPEGFEAGEIDTSAGSTSSGGSSFAVINLSRTYTSKADNGPSVTITLTSSKEMIAAQKAMLETLKSPEMVKAMQASGETFKPVEQDGWVGMRHISKEGPAEIIVFSKTCMLNVKVDKADAKTLDQFWKLIDLKSLPADVAEPKK
jgi:hypothetical protein